MDNELWLPVPDHGGLFASSLGRIKTRDAILKETFDGGYQRVNIGPRGSRRQIRVHVLVAAAFFGKRPPGLDINHKDGNKKNNRPVNLEYCTRRHNCQHAYRLGLNTVPGLKGEQNANAKLREAEVLEIRSLLKESVPQRVIAARFKISQRLVNMINVGQAWRHVPATTGNPYARAAS